MVDKETWLSPILDANMCVFVDAYYLLNPGQSVTLGAGAVMSIESTPVQLPPTVTFVSPRSEPISVVDRETWLSPIVDANMCAFVDAYYLLNPGVALTLGQNAVMRIM